MNQVRMNSTSLGLMTDFDRFPKSLRYFIAQTRDQSQISIYTASQKNITDIFDCNLKTNYQILVVIFGRNIPSTTCHQITIPFPISPNVCFFTT